MKKTKLLMITLGLMLSLPALANKERVIVSFNTETVSPKFVYQDLHSVETDCHSLSNGEDLCITTPAKSSFNSIRSNGNQKANIQSVTVKVPDGVSIQEVKSRLEQSGLYSAVEMDVPIQSYSWNVPTPNDREFSRQLNYFNQNSAAFPVASSILPMWAKLKNPTKSVELYVMDGAFRNHSDMIYQSGFNFTVVSFDNERRPGFIESEFNAECTSDHGIQVASTAAATVNNGNGMAGVVDNVNVTPIRVLNCRNGFLSDVSAALDWLSGNDAYLRTQSPAIPVFNGQAGVINMSLGGNVGGSCPFYLQNAINKAVEKGFIIVAAAGNENDNVANYSPANCDNVVTVGAANVGTTLQPADKASFSNYGEKVDVMAQGQSIVGLAKEENLVLWSGTSASSPIVAGIITAVLKDFSLTSSDVLNLIRISGVKRWKENSDCEQLGCGSGILDASLFYDNAEKLMSGTLNTVDYALNSVQPCKQAWAVKYLSRGTNLCNVISVTLDGFFLSSGEYIEISTSPLGQEPTDLNRTILSNFDKTTFTVDKSDVLNKNVQARKCNNNNSCSTWFDVGTDNLANAPAICD